jgi:HIP---CoA ligase
MLGSNLVELLVDVPGLESLQEIVVLEGPARVGCTTVSEFAARASEAHGPEVARRRAALDGNNASDIIFTSGTTGKPKGAVLGHGASVRTYLAWSDLVGLRRGDRYLVVYPFFHTAGLKSGVLACVLRGATILPHAVFDVVPVMQRVAAERITMLPGPPTVFQSILNHPEFASFDLSSLRLSVTGAATVPVDVIRRMRADLRFETVVTGYGLTETTGTVSMCRHDDPPEVIATTVGRPLPGVNVRIMDAEGNSVAPGDPGEILVQGFNVMKEYFEDPAATKEAIDEDGWLSTGDIGVLGHDGNLRITDRKKDMYIVGGFNAYPAEIEGIMVGHPQVGQVAVVGIPDGRLGEVGVAFVVPRPGQDVDPDEVVAWCRDHMANFKVPRSVRIVDSLPLNPTGKVMKFELRAQLAG